MTHRERIGSWAADLDPEAVPSLAAQVAANEVAGRLGAARFIGPHNGQFWASIHCASAAIELSTAKLSPTFPARLGIRLRSGREIVLEGAEPGSCNRPLDEQHEVVEERLAVAAGL